MLVDKEIISPGVVWYKDGKGQPHAFVATPERIKRFYDDGRAMLDSGLSIPIPLEHQPDSKALTAAEKAANQLKNNTGWVNGFEMRGEKLFAQLDIQDEEVAKKLPKTIKWTSPYIDSFMDGNGKQWEGVISHLALTARPRIVKQEPFSTMAAAMSLMEKEVKEEVKIEGGFLLHRGLWLSKKGKKLKPRFPKAFSMLTGIPLAEKPLIDEEEEDAEDEHEFEHGEEHEEKEEKHEHVKSEGGSDTISIHDMLCKLLSILGIELPEEGSDPKLFEACALTAIMEKIKSKMGNDMETPETTGTLKSGEKKMDNPIIQEQRPSYMSLEDIEKLTDPVLKQLAFSLHQEQKKTASLEKNAIEAARKVREARLAKIKKFFPKALEKIQTQGVGFSLQDDGTVKDELAPTLEILEAALEEMKQVPELLLSTNTNTRFDVQPHPTEFDGKMSEERRQAIVKEFSRNGGIPEKK